MIRVSTRPSTEDDGVDPPARVSPAAPRTNGSPVNARPIRPNLTAAPFLLYPRKLLVVDDDRLNTRILISILEAEGYVLESAASGENALEVYERFRPNLVLLDVMLPGIDGFETCRALKRTYGDKCSPVIFITAKSDSDDVVQGLEAGGVDYLPKPFKAKEVVARIRSHVQSQILGEQKQLLVEQLRQANTAKNRFLGMAAHDLRNPLASIRGIAEFLRDGTLGPLNQEQIDMVQTIHSASQSMLDLVNELLDVTSIEAGELKLRLAEHDLGELVGKSVGLMNMEAARKKTHITFTADDPHVRIVADAGKMKQLIENLLSNAVKYSPPGSQVLVTLETESTLGACELAVRDQGPGIRETERDLLFKDYGRLSSKPTGGEKSTGLGLAICRKIVEAHRGTITVQNHPAGGSEFRVTLPKTS